MGIFSPSRQRLPEKGRLILIEESVVRHANNRDSKALKHDTIGGKNLSCMETVTNPATTGGSGPSFEFKVGAACLTLLLTRGAPLFLETGALSAVHFQTKYLGWETDDLLLEAVNEHGVVSKAAIQVKLSFVLSDKDAECIKTVRRAFTDFRNTTLFDQNRDVVGVVTSSLSARLARGMRSLLDCARASTDPADMVQRLQIPGYLGRPAHDNYKTIVSILQELEGQQPTEEEIWRFLNRFNIVDLDLNIESGITEILLRSLLAVTARDGNPSSANATWNELHTCAATRSGSAVSFTYAKLPEHIRQRHDRASGFPAGVTRLLEDTRVVLEGIRTTIGGQTEIPRRELFGQLCQLIEENSLVFVTGEAGSGKSVLAKMGFSLATQGALGFAFRAESLAGTHINEVLAKFGLTLDGLRAQTALHGRKVLWVESLERLMEKDAEQRAAFLDLLRALKKEPTWRVIVTCRDYSAETVKSAFFGEVGIPYADLFVPELDDAELDEVIAKFPNLQRPMSCDALRRLLRKPFLLDKAVLMQWPSTEPLPQHERAFREKVWREVVRRVDEGLAIGLPRLRGEVLVEVALRRAKAMEPFVSVTDLDARALHGLVRDSLLTSPAIGDNRFAPAHDVFEDWALADWLDVEFERGGRRLDVLFVQVGTYPALRRAFRKWLTELLDIFPQATDPLVIDTICNSSVEAHWRDDTLVGVLLSADAGGFLRRNAALLNANGAKFLRQVIHLLRVACKAAIPRRLFGIEGTGDVFLPRGNGWNGAAELMETSRTLFGETDFPFVLRFLEDWVQLTRWGVHYPKGAKSIAKLALYWLPKVESWRCPVRDGRERLFKILLSMPLAAEPELSQMAMTAMKDKERYHDYRELLELMFNHFYADALCRDMPDLAVSVAEYSLGLHLPLEQALSSGSGYEMNAMNDAFGLGFRLSSDDYPASAYHGTFFKFLLHHPQRGLDFILKFVNRACEAYAHPSNRRRGMHGPTRVSIRFPDGTTQKQYGDGRLWELYRDFTQGPDILKSALMALERWLLEKAKRRESDLSDILNRLLHQSNNIAVTAVVASVATAYPDQAGDAAFTVLTCKYFFESDLNRSVSESMNPRLNSGMWLGIEKKLYDEERAESAQLPHRQQNLEYLAVMLQTFPVRERVWELIDAYKAELPKESEQDEGAKVWRFRLHQMDTRNFVVAGKTEDGQVLIQASTPPPELQEMIDAKKPQRDAWETAMNLVVWGQSVFTGKSQHSIDPKQWKAKLAAAQTQLVSASGFTDEVHASIAAAGPAYIAAVCIRDHWAELSDTEQKWCILLICDSVEADANSTDQFKIAAMNPMNAARPAAFILPVLFEKQLQPPISLRLLPALAKAVTHSVDEVVKYVIQGIGIYLWKTDRSLALTCIHALILKATEQHQFWSERRRQPFGDRPAEDQFAANLQMRLRGFVEKRQSGDDAAILQLDLTNWPGRQIAAHLFTILGEQTADALAREFFRRDATMLAARWEADNERQRSRAGNSNDDKVLDSGVEHLCVDSLTQFVLQLPAQEAIAISEPILTIATRFPEKAAEFVKWLVIRQGDRIPASTLWSLWQRFADDFSASSLPTSVDDKHSDSAKLMRELFLGDNWGEARDWKPLHGEEQRIRMLFDRLPASQQGFETYAYFLATIGSPALPDALLSIAAKLPPTEAVALFSETAVFYLESILTRLIYGGNRRIRIEPKLRQSAMILLDVLVAVGSSVAYKLRDDFLTPVPK